MKIAQLENKAALTAVTTERRAATPGAPASAVEASAKVDLSQSLALKTAIGHEASFDQKKVDRIAQAIREGRFTVNPEAIADRLIANAQELLGKAPR